MPVFRSPFLKWAGGKRRLVPFIVEALGFGPSDAAEKQDAPPRSGSEGRPMGKRIIEPFAGSAAVSLALADRFDALWLNDVNVDLMNVYSALQSGPDEYIRSAGELFRPEANDAETYYRFRDKFNELHHGPERAALFLYLNRHGYNGLCRYNKGGAFNVPFGRYKRPYFPEAELRAAAQVLPKAKLTSLDFEDVMKEAGLGDFVYCDPPYVPLSASASFTDYASGGFTLEDQRRLAEAAAEAAGRGAVVAVSNHATEWTRELYRDADLHYAQVHRSISANGQTRGRVEELLAVFWPVAATAETTNGRRTADHSERAGA